MNAIDFEISVDGLPHAALQVVQFEGEEAMTRPYRFDIDVVASDPSLPMEALLAKPATLSLKRGGKSRTIHGVILDISESEEAAGGFYAYRLTLVPRIRLLALSKHNRCFGTQAPMSVIDVVQSVLMDPEGVNLTRDDLAVRVLKREAYPARDFWAQYDENDLDFVHRLLEHWGLFYYFEQTDQHERLVISDATALAPEQGVDATLAFDNRSGHIPHRQGIARSVSRRMRTVTKNVYLNDYNDQTPHVPATAHAGVTKGQIGAYYEYATHFLNETEGKMFAQVRAEEIGCTHDVFKIATDSPFLAAGATFQIAGHFRAGLNQSYLPTSIRHTGQQSLAGAFSAAGAAEEGGYKNVIVAIPDHTAYRSPRRHRRPVMAGIMPATVDAPDGQGDRAYLDAQGRYKVNIGFDTAESAEYQKSAFLRMAQPYGGPSTGMHFPLLKGTEVMIGWVDGDPDRPLILGAVPNPLTSSPVTKLNQTQNKIRTASGMAIIMDDGAGTSATGGASSGGGGAPSPRSSAGAADDHSMAFMVPAAAGTLPHYLRLGDIEVKDSYETDIVADASFMAGKLEYRGAALTNAQYAGVFSYTPDHRTTTTGGNETVVIGGDQRIFVAGNSSTTVGDTSDPVVVTANTDYYVGTVSYVPIISFTLGESVSHTTGVSYSGSIGVAINVNMAGSFGYSAGPTVTLTSAIGPDYTISTGGSISGGNSDLGESSEAYFADKFVVGYRSSGKTIMSSIATRARVAAGLAVAMNVGMDVAQRKVAADSKADEQLDNKGVAGVELVNGIASAALVAAGVAMKIGSQYNSVDHVVLESNIEKEPTFTIDKNGITLSHGSSSISIQDGKITLLSDSISLHATNRLELSASDYMTYMAITKDRVYINHKQLNVQAPVLMRADVEVGQALKVGGSVNVTGDVSAKKLTASLAASIG